MSISHVVTVVVAILVSALGVRSSDNEMEQNKGGRLY